MQLAELIVGEEDGVDVGFEHFRLLAQRPRIGLRTQEDLRRNREIPGVHRVFEGFQWLAGHALLAGQQT